MITKPTKLACSWLRSSARVGHGHAAGGSCGHRRNCPHHNVRQPAVSPLSICSPVLCAHYRSRNETIEGTVFTHDSTAGVVVIEQKGAGDKSTYRMLRSNAVKELEVLAPPADHRQWAGENEAELPVVDLDAVHARYERAVAKVKVAVERARRARRPPTPHTTTGARCDSWGAHTAPSPHANPRAAG